MTGRRITIALHWASFLALYLVWSLTPDWPVWLLHLFSAVGLAWALTYVLRLGPLFAPGPKLQGWTRPVHRIQHHALYIAVAALSAGFIIGMDERTAYIAVQVLFFTGLAHGCFHAWRHTALYDGALRKITPRALHRIL